MPWISPDISQSLLPNLATLRRISLVFLTPKHTLFFTIQATKWGLYFQRRISRSISWPLQNWAFEYDTEDQTYLRFAKAYCPRVGAWRSAISLSLSRPGWLCTEWTRSEGTYIFWLIRATVCFLYIAIVSVICENSDWNRTSEERKDGEFSIIYSILIWYMLNGIAVSGPRIDCTCDVTLYAWHHVVNQSVTRWRNRSIGRRYSVSRAMPFWGEKKNKYKKFIKSWIAWYTKLIKKMYNKMNHCDRILRYAKS